MAGCKLDKQQIDAVVACEDAQLVLASAGSGKTLSLLAKIEYLVRELQIEPESILAISFTKKTVDELIERCEIKGVEFRTFHALGKSILDFNENSGLTSLSLISEADTEKFLNDWLYDTLSEECELSRRLAIFILLQFSSPTSPGDFTDHPARVRFNQLYLRRDLENILASDIRNKKKQGIKNTYRFKEDQLIAD